MNYPKMLYKSREDYRIAKNTADHEDLKELGFVEFSELIKGPAKSDKVDFKKMSWHELRGYAKKIEKETKKEVYKRGMKQKELIEVLECLQPSK